MDRCLDDDILLDFIRGQLDPGRMERVEAHVARCGDCRRLLSALARTEVVAPPPDGTELALAEEGGTPFAPGSEVGPYVIMRVAGRGGMGEVFVARDTQLGRKVALKIIRPDTLGSAEARRRFLFEARTTASFSHPNIVTVYAVGEHMGHPYLALEYLEGQSLDQRLEQERPVPRDAMRIALAMAEALREAHERGVLHRDLKPANVMLPRDGRVRVLDFGLAQRSAAPSTGGEVTEAPLPLGDVIEAPRPSDGALDATASTFISHGRGLRGSPPYMAPEQWLMKPCTPATDIWALGVVLYEMLVGHRPFTGASMLELRQRVVESREPPEPPEPLESARCGAPGEVAAVAEVEVAEVAEVAEVVELALRCLRREPERRPAADEVVQILDRLLSGRGEGRDLQRRECPFRGLSPFGEQHSADFHGRERAVAAFLERLRERPVLPLAGPSGVGKSSLVQAGIFPRLREQGDWTLLGLRPGRTPFIALAERLVFGESTIRDEGSARDPHPSAPPSRSGSGPKTESGGGGRGRREGRAEVPDGEDAPAAPSEDRWREVRRLAEELEASPRRLANLLYELSGRQGRRVLLFIDQLEELFTHVDDVGQRRRFLEAVCTAADDHQDPVRVILAVRDDFLYRLVAGAPDREALDQVTFVSRPGPATLREILELPLARLGYAFDDPELPAQIVAEVSGEAACLPLLQFTARMLWERRDRQRRLVTRAVYESLGGVAGALARHADGVLDGLSPDELDLARAMLLRLVTGEGTRRVLPAGRALEGLGAVAPQVLAQLTRARLVTARKGRREASDTEIELVHEALIRAWGRLARWVEEDRESLTALAEVGQTAEMWERRGRREEEVWSGEALAEARLLLRRAPSRVPAVAREFIDAGLAQQRRQRQRRRLGVVVGVGLLAVIAAAASVAAWTIARQKGEAQRQRGRAEQRLAQAELRSARLAFVQERPTEAWNKLRASLELEDSVGARALLRQLRRSPLLWRRELGSVVFAVAFSPDGRSIAAAGRDRRVNLLDLPTRGTRVLHRHTNQVLAAVFSAQGTLLATGDAAGEVRVHDLTRQVTRKISGPAGAVWSLAFAPDGTLWATGGPGGAVLSCPPGQRRASPWTPAGGCRAGSLALSPDGDLLAAGCSDHVVRVWQLKSGELRHRLRGHTRRVYRVRFAPGGRRLASAGADRTIHLWRLGGSGALEHVVRGHEDTVFDISFDRDGERLASSSHDQTVRVWRVATGEEERVLRGHRAMVFGLAFHPRGGLLASGGYDKTVHVWQLPRPDPLVPSAGHSSSVLAAAFSPDGAQIASGSADRTIRLWDARTGRTVASLSGHKNSVSALCYLQPHSQIVSGSYDQTVRLWGRLGELNRLRGHADKIRALGCSGDGRRFASAAEDGTVRLWSAADHRIVHVLSGHRGGAFSASFSPDGRRLAASSGKRVSVWDTQTGQEIRRLPTSADLWDASFSPDGLLLAATGSDGDLRIWRTDTWRQRRLNVDRGRLLKVTFHPDSARVSVTTGNGLIHLLALDGSARRTLRGHGQEVNAVSFSPDGRRLASASDDGTLRLWHVESSLPVWRAPLMRASPPELCTHRGWIQLESGRTRPADTAWGRAVASRALRAAVGAAGRTLCLLTARGGLEIWSLREDRRVGGAAVPGAVRVAPLGRGCLVERAAASPGPRRVAHHLPGRGPEQILPRSVHVALLASDGKRALIQADPGRLLLLGGDRTVGRSVAVDRTSRATAAAHHRGGILIGHADGRIGAVAPHSSAERLYSPLSGAPSAPVTALLAGPQGTLIAGFATGQLGLWDPHDGSRLADARLHGPVVHLLSRAERLYAATELGDAVSWDLTPLVIDHSTLMKTLPANYLGSSNRISPTTSTSTRR